MSFETQPSKIIRLHEGFWILLASIVENNTVPDAVGPERTKTKLLLTL